MNINGLVGTFNILASTNNSLNPKPPLCKSGALPLSYEPISEISV